MRPNACTTQKIKYDMVGLTGGKDRASSSTSTSSSSRLPPELLDIIKPALQVGGLSGATGLFIGTFAGILRSKTPIAFATASGISWASMGTTFWATRGAVIHAWGGALSPRDKVKASGIGGGAAGFVGAILNGRGRTIPYSIIMTLLGAGGQTFYNRIDERKLEQAQNQSGDEEKKSWWDSKWSPVRALPDQEYETILRERILRVDMRIEMLDEAIEALREEEIRVGQEKAEKETEERARLEDPGKKV